MFWRFHPISDPSIEYIIIRDTDSRFSRRESVAVQEWIASGKSMHIIRDHPLHNIAILGGLWGIKGGLVKDIRQKINQWRRHSIWSLDRKHTRYGADQIFLKEVLYQKFKEDALIHSECVRFQGETPIPISVQRQNNEFLGQRHPENPEDLEKQINVLIKNENRLVTHKLPGRNNLWKNSKRHFKNRLLRHIT